MLSQVLASDATLGYEEIYNIQVLSFNGTHVANLKCALARSLTVLNCRAVCFAVVGSAEPLFGCLFVLMSEWSWSGACSSDFCGLESFG